MPRLSIRLLGPFDVALVGEVVTGFVSDKVRALLAYLAMTPDQSHRRESLAGLLWPEYPERSARASLRKALSNLRRVTGDHEASPPFLLVTRQTIRFNADSDQWLDAAEFSTLLATDELVSDTLGRAVALYRGPFLQGFSTPDSAAFEEWLLLTREQLSRQVGETLHDLAHHYQIRGEYQQALSHAWRHVELDPWREDAQRQLMFLLALDGQRSAALAQYEACCQALAAELGVEPEPETMQLCEQIRDGRLETQTVLPRPVPQSEPIPRLPGFVTEDAQESRSPVFVARKRELAWLRDKLEDTLAGHGRVVLVTGGPGRGKTALLDEFARQAMAAHDGLLVASGSCNAYSGVGDPYLPFREVLAMLTGDVEAAWAAGAITRDHAQRLWAALPLAGQALLYHGPHVVPALIAGTPLLSRLAAATPAGATWVQQLRDRIEHRQIASEALEEPDLFRQVTNLLRALAEVQPLLLVLDDLQWVDASSAGLLFHLGRRLAGSRILITGAFRPEEITSRHADLRQPHLVPHPLDGVLAEMQRQYGDVLLDLTAVPEPEGRQFVENLLDAEPNRLEEAFRRELFAHAGGHPLFTAELLRAMKERGDLLPDEAGAWVEGSALDWATLPPRVEGIIHARIGRLDEELQAFLSVASVEGETFTAQVVGQVQEVGERQILRRLSQELEVRHRLVREQPVLLLGGRRLSRYRFAHALFQQHLYNALGDGERAMLHAEIARVLEDLYAGHLEEVTVQLAYHYSEAGDDQRARTYFTLAGDVALAAYANQEAEAHWRRALGLEPPAAEEADLLASLGEALVRQNRFREAMAFWRDGIKCFQALADSDAVARLYARSAWAAREADDPLEALKLCREGLAQLENAPDGPGLAYLLHETAGAYLTRALRDEGEPFARQALEMAERLGHVELQAHALATLSTFPTEFPEESRAIAARALDLAEANGLLLAGQRAHRNLAALALVRSFDYPTAHDHFHRSASLAEQAGLTALQIYALAQLVPVGLHFGEFSEARKTLSQAKALFADLNEPTRAQTKVLLSELFYLGPLGDWAACARLARELRASTHERGAERDIADAAFWLGWAILESRRLGTEPYAGEWQEAEAALEEAAAIFDRSLSPAFGVRVRIHWSHLCVCQGRVADAQHLLAEANERAILQTAAVNEGHPHWVAGRLAAAAGRWVEAMHCLDAADKAFARLGARWWSARLLLDRAEAHVSHGRPDDRMQAAKLLRKARDAFQEMGVPRYAAIAQERLQELATADPSVEHE